MARAHQSPAWLPGVGAACLPAVAALLAKPWTSDGVLGLFQCELVGLVALATVSGFLAAGARAALWLSPAAAILLGLAHLLLGGPAAGAPWVAWIALGVGYAAAGLAHLGWAIGAPRVSAMAVSVTVLGIAMSGLAWVDAAADQLPVTSRPRFRQAVLYVDPALALAYDGLAYERLRDPAVYAEHAVASHMLERPAAGPTGATWLALGLLGVGVAHLVGRPARGS